MLSIIFPVLNEKQNIIEQTIDSITKHSPDDIEIIIIDDCSEQEINFKQKYNKNIIFYRNPFRIGAAQSKHLGVTFSTKPYIFLTDGHVLFDKNYYNYTISCLNNNYNTLFCGACLGLSESNFNIDSYNGIYYGARFFLNENKELLDGKWVGDKKEEEYEISCVMGANYFMHKSHFFNIRGYSELKAWGSEEPCLSIKSWLSGGNVKINKNVRIGHMFRNKSPYSTGIKYLIYNKIRMILSFINDNNLKQILLNKINNDINKQDAWFLINKDIKVITEHQLYYKLLFKRDIHWFCHKFHINIPSV